MTDLRAKELSESEARLAELKARGVAIHTNRPRAVGSRPPSNLVERIMIGRKHINRTLGMKLRGVAK